MTSATIDNMSDTMSELTLQQARDIAAEALTKAYRRHELACKELVEAHEAGRWCGYSDVIASYAAVSHLASLVLEHGVLRLDEVRELVPTLFDPFGLEGAEGEATP